MEDARLVAFVLTYKLCERGEATLPVASLTFWKGVVRSVNNTMDKYINIIIKQINSIE